MNKHKQGFTLIELLVVLAIIGLLSTLGVVAFGSLRQTARDSTRLADLRQIQVALELHYLDNTAYPTEATAVTLGSGNYACLNSSGWAASGCSDPYMGIVPGDPGDNSFSYTSADGTTYTIDGTLEGTVDNYTGDIQATPAGIADVAE